jgi:hypothetical protein
MLGRASAGMPRGVPYSHHDLAAAQFSAERNATARLGVFGGIVEQVGEDLGRAGEVGVQVDGRYRGSVS